MLLKGAVIGSSVEAAYYALVNEHHFIPTRKTPQVFYKTLTAPILGTNSEAEAWTKASLTLGLLSKKVWMNALSTVRVTEDIIRVIQGNTSFKYRFEKLFVFDPTGVQLHNEILEANPKTHIVFDDFEISVLGPKRYELQPITGGSEFVKELHFYSSDRVDGADFITDCMVESELSIEQLGKFDFSDTMVRFVVERHLASIGVHGRLMSYYKNGKPKYRKPKVVHVKRVVCEKDNNIYKDTESIKFLNLSLEDIIEESSQG